MSEEQDYIIVTLGGDSDDDNDDGFLTENSETEYTENTVSTDGVLPLQPNFQSSSDNSQSPSQMSNGVEGLAGLGDQPVSQMNYPENLRIYNPDLAEVEFIPLHNEGTSSVSKQDNVVRNASGIFDKETHQSQLVELQHYCEGLQDLIENTNKQVTQLCGIISKMQNNEKEQSSLNRASPVVPTAGEPSLANTPEMMGYHSMGPDIASSSVHIPHNFEMNNPQTNLQENVQMMNSPPFLGNNNNGQEGDKAQANQEQNTQTMNNPSFSGNNHSRQNIPRVLIVSTVGGNKVLTNQEQSTQMMNNPPFLRNNHCGQNITHVLIVSHVERDNTQSNHKENSQMMNNPQVLGSNMGGQDIPCVIILSNQGDTARNNREENTQTTSNTPVLGNSSGARDIPRILIFCDGKGGKAQNNWEKNTQTMNNRQMLGNAIGGRDIARVLILCDNEMDKVQIKQEENTQMMNNPEVLGNNTDSQDTPRVLIHSHGNSSTEIKSEPMIHPISVKTEIKEENIDSGSYFITPGYALLPLDIIIKADSMENSHGTMFSPIVLETDNSHESSSSSESIPLDMGYLGDPKRNITIPRMHLVIAQRKSEPKQAARYLVRNLFSREVLICSTASANSNLPNPSGRQPLDPNIMAALREYLITIFPNHDLSECGRDWRACISYVNSLIRYLCSAAKKHPHKTVVPTKRSTPASVDLDDKRDADGGEGSSLLPKQAAASETSASGNSQPSSAVSKGLVKPSTSASVLPYKALCYIGNPRRNVQVSYLVKTVAKRKACPQMAASYLLGHLFSEDVLLNSSVYGNLWHGLCALNSNKINAIREFLQDIYPACDLSEGGRDWKMCVSSMNHYIRTLKPGYWNFTSEPSSSSETSSSSSKSESSDTDLSD